ncbi:MAG: carbohydrate kinase family protein, partial [Deltaproteobacteria bacterium]|nr:carbohydrate kinase family protein [Deltaproteobacteria bacterium]
MAGHICLDIAPALPAVPAYRPNTLMNVGGATVATGGCVANVG